LRLRRGPRAHSATRPRSAPQVKTSRPLLHEKIARRRRSVAREVGQKRLKVVGLIAALVVFSIGGFFVAHSPLISARHIEIRGARHTSAAEILSVSGLFTHPPLIDINIGVDEQAIERLAWVKTAVVTVSFPSTVEVRVRERLAVAAVASKGGGYALLDPSGEVLSRIDQRPTSVVAILGVTDVPRPGRLIPLADRGLVTTAASVPTDLVGRISDIRRTSGDGIVIVMRNAPEAIFGSTANLHEKFVALATVLSDVALGGVRSIDLRAPSNPVLTP